MQVISKTQFRNAKLELKGYMVYMFGMRDDQPNVPAVYEVSGKSYTERYNYGTAMGIQEAQDCP